MVGFHFYHSFEFVYSLGEVLNNGRYFGRGRVKVVAISAVTDATLLIAVIAV